MGDEHLSTTSETKSDKIIKSSVENLVPILREYKGIFDNTCDVPVCEDSSTFDVLKDHSEILSDSNNDDTLSDDDAFEDIDDDDAFEDIEYVEASLLVPELVSLEEENVEKEEFNLEDIQDVVLREKLLRINLLIANIESLNDNPTPDCMINNSASFLIFEESNNSLSDNSLPEFETFSDQTEETGSDNSIPSGIENFGYDSKGDIGFLEELLIDDSIPFPNNESFDFEDDPLFPLPPSKPSDVEFFFDLEPDVIAEEISNELNEDNCVDLGGEINVLANIEDDDYFPFMFVIRMFLPYLIYPKVFPLLLFTGSEDIIFDLGIFV
nr:hypothetical protein [Tanacetum cinerariifolium]